MATRADNPEAELRETFEFPVGDEMRGERATLGRSLLDVQRDLRIKAAYIAAIENADPDVFPNPSFIPGYVRSYARYLGMEADAAYARFCAESGFAGPNATARPDRTRRAVAATAQPTGVFRPNFPMADPRWRGAPSLPFSAIGSVLVLVGLVGGLGYGGWTVLQNIQRVQFAPVEEIPMALASVEALTPPDAPAVIEPALSELARPVAATALADLYRQQELEVPILVPRDGPIAGIDPERIGLAAAATARSLAQPSPDAGGAVATALQTGEPQLVATVERPTLTVVAERAAWIRVYLADGTVLFERILETGETYAPPAEIVAPLIWAGNSGSVFVRLDATLHGPLGTGTRAVRDVALDPASIAEAFAAVPADGVPEAIARAFDPAVAQATIAQE